jgi:hypothetical protein
LVFITIGHTRRPAPHRLARDEEKLDAVVAGLERNLVAAVEQHQRWLPVRRDEGLAGSGFFR